MGRKERKGGGMGRKIEGKEMIWGGKERKGGCCDDDA